MFLVFCSTAPDIIQCIANSIEEYPVLVGGVAAVVTSSLWLRKFLRQKRAEAFFGFYAKLSLLLQNLRVTLDENGQLNVSEPEAGNIYALLYAEATIKSVCPAYSTPDEKELDLYKKMAIDLGRTLIDTDNNVYPHNANRKEWYESQQTLYNFCEFLQNYKEYKNTTNIPDTDSGLKHIVKCKALINAIDYIQDSINRTEY